MTALLIAGLTATMVATAFLSGIFGMAGGMVLIGVLLAVMTLPAAMALHAVTQLASNGWRAVLWHRHINWRPVGAYLTGAAAALLVWSIWRWVPSTPVALIFLGVTPFMLRLLPPGLKPNPMRPTHGAAFGAICMSLMLLTGVSGPLLDSFFLGGGLERRTIVATKAVCQVFSHAAKLLYFGALIDQAATLDPLMATLAVAASMLGTTLARRVLEAMTDHQFRLWANRVITTIAGYYVVQGTWLLIAV